MINILSSSSLHWIPGIKVYLFFFKTKCSVAMHVLMQNKNFNDDESDTKLSINSETNSWLWPTASVDQKAEDSSILSAIILEKG